MSYFFKVNPYLVKYKSFRFTQLISPVLNICESFSDRLPAPCLLNDAVAVCHSMQVGIFEMNDRYLAGAKRSFPSEAAYYSLLYTYWDLRTKIHRDKDSLFALEKPADWSYDYHCFH